MPLGNFVERPILRNPDSSWRYSLLLPDFLAEWDVWEYWERERLLSMEARLKKSDVLFEVGAESGWMACLFAKYFVEPQNMVLFEPTPEYWPNIYQTWKANLLWNPKVTCQALVGNPYESNAIFHHGTWPEGSDGVMTPARSYRYIHEHGMTTPQTSLDQFCAFTNVIPNALTIDVEGAEYRVLQGAHPMLRKYKPLVWVSLHPDLMLKHYGNLPDQIHELMRDCGYQGQFLAEDHEVHFLYEPDRRKRGKS